MKHLNSQKVTHAGIGWSDVLTHRIAHAVVGLFVLATFLSLSMAVKAASPTSIEREQVQQIIHDYLLAHPEVVIDALQAAEAKQKQKEAEAARAAIAAKRDELLNDPSTPSEGDPKGDVTLVEFFDYRCPYCKRVEPAVEALLHENPKLRIVYKEFPILGPESTVAAHVALAAFKEGRYEPFHRAMMATKGQITEDVIMKVAAQSGLDIAAIKLDINAPAIGQIIKRNYDLADALGIRGTPSFVIGDNVFSGAVDLATLNRMVAAARAPH